VFSAFTSPPAPPARLRKRSRRASPESQPGNWYWVSFLIGELSRSSSDGTRTVYVSLDGPLPEEVGADLQIDATIDIEKLDNVLYVGRPVHASEHAIGNSPFSLFKIVNDGTEAVRVNVKLGRASVNTIEVLDGLKEGDKVILSDMSSYDNADRLHLK
jgi:HlyD family secretion protein